MKTNIINKKDHPTLKQMGYSSRRPHQVPRLLAKNRKLSAVQAAGAGVNISEMFSWHILSTSVPTECSLNAYLSTVVEP